MTFQERYQRWDAHLVPPLLLPTRFQEATPLQIPREDLRHAVRRYVTDLWAQCEAGVAPAYLGRAGQWKTYAAACIARYVHHQRLWTEWVECGPEFTRLDMQYYDVAGQQRLRELCEVPFLVLDDFTQVTERSRAATLLETVVQSRFSNRLPICWTGNLPLASKEQMLGMTEKYGACITRRILHGSTGHRVDVV